MPGYIVAIDQGTTGSTVMVVSSDGRIVSKAGRDFPQHFPSPGWVEHDLSEIWTSVTGALHEALAGAKIAGSDVRAIGITNQRETTVVWDRKTGAPIHRAIVWQDRRTAGRCDELRASGLLPVVRARTGLVLDPYFSGTKVAWILDHVPGARARAERGELAFGTIDSWLVGRLTGGTRHVTDASNASRTLLFDLHALRWDPELASAIGVPLAVLPEVRGNAEVYGETRGLSVLPDGVPIAGMAGDQQSALFGQACFGRGDAKCTYGTGAFLLLNTGKTPVASGAGLLTTVAWQLGAETTYALEGSTFVAGAAVQWLRDGLGIIKNASDVEALAREVASSDGVVFVPALTGLGAPHWDANARGLIAGITRGTRAPHIARATLEGIALQVADVVTAMSSDVGAPIERLRVDGGAAANDLLMQFQADVLGATVERPTSVETTALGAAALAGLGAGLFKSLDELRGLLRVDRRYAPAMSAEERRGHLQRWGDALRRARTQPDGGA